MKTKKIPFVRVPRKFKKALKKFLNKEQINCMGIQPQNLFVCWNKDHKKLYIRKPTYNTEVTIPKITENEFALPNFN